MIHFEACEAEPPLLSTLTNPAAAVWPRMLRLLIFVIHHSPQTSGKHPQIPQISSIHKNKNVMEASH
jgi:hypothetical protein